MGAITECLKWCLKLRISYYPTPLQRKLIVAHGFNINSNKSETVRLIVKKHFAEMSKDEVEKLIKIYDDDVEGEIRKLEKNNYIEKV